MNDSVEHELWRIFTFYTLHSDPNQPELMKPATFIRFCKDCQIASKQLTPTAIELEITRLTRTYEANKDYTTSQTIAYAGFLTLLDVLAQKLYKNDIPDLALRRLLLENVLLLASRRVQSQSVFVETVDAEANKVLRDVFGKSLQRIFDYYRDKADKRRNQAVTAEAMAAKDLRQGTVRDVSALSAEKAANLSNKREIARAQKQLIGFREFMQFCYDYNLKSTSLLTAIQVGEIFLSTVPPTSTSTTEDTAQNNGFKQGESLGMTLELFLRALLSMARLAYRDQRTSQAGKLKALLLYMWKAVNDSSRTKQLVSSNRNSTLTHFAGSLNVYGSGLFSDTFLNQWMKDGYADYTIENDSSNQTTGATMLKAVLAHHQHDGSNLSSSAVLDSVQRSLTLATAASVANNASINATSASSQQKEGPASSPSLTTKAARRTNSIYITSFTDTVRNKAATTTEKGRPMIMNNSAAAVRPIRGTVALEGESLVQLLRRRPELAEYLHLEIRNMNISSSALVAAGGGGGGSRIGLMKESMG